VSTARRWRWPSAACGERYSPAMSAMAMSAPVSDKDIDSREPSQPGVGGFGPEDRKTKRQEGMRHMTTPMAEAGETRSRATPLSGEGRLEVEDGYRIAYRIFGTGSRTLLGLHGGPGASSRYLDRLSEVVGGDRKLVLYDQPTLVRGLLGHPRSAHPHGLARAPRSSPPNRIPGETTRCRDADEWPAPRIRPIIAIWQQPLEVGGSAPVCCPQPSACRGTPPLPPGYSLPLDGLRSALSSALPAGHGGGLRRRSSCLSVFSRFGRMANAYSGPGTRSTVRPGRLPLPAGLGRYLAMTSVSASGTSARATGSAIMTTIGSSSMRPSGSINGGGRTR